MTQNGCPRLLRLACTSESAPARARRERAEQQHNASPPEAPRLMHTRIHDRRAFTRENSIPTWYSIGEIPIETSESKHLFRTPDDAGGFDDSLHHNNMPHLHALGWVSRGSWTLGIVVLLRV